MLDFYYKPRETLSASGEVLMTKAEKKKTLSAASIR
jgi:hypothetical protein